MSTTLTVPDSSRGLLDLVDQVSCTAAEAGVPVKCLGVQPLFDETRLYAGETSGWVLAPAEDDAHAQSGSFRVPRAQLADLHRLEYAGLNFPAIYVAHEVPNEQTIRGTLPARQTHSEIDVVRQSRTITPTAARALVGPIPPPARTVRRSANMGQVATSIFKQMAKSVPVMAGLATGAVAAPFVLLSQVEFDPIIFGAVPLYDTLMPGTPAVWFELTRWTW